MLAAFSNEISVNIKKLSVELKSTHALTTGLNPLNVVLEKGQFLYVKRTSPKMIVKVRFFPVPDQPTLTFIIS